jgi:hypothetical protein
VIDWVRFAKNGNHFKLKKFQKVSYIIYDKKNSIILKSQNVYSEIGATSFALPC